MKVVLFVLGSLLPSLLCKELPLAGVTNDEKHVLSRIMKRLGKSNFTDDNRPDKVKGGRDDGDDSGETGFGNVTVNDGIFITSDDSNGARLLYVLESVDSSKTCADRCHKNSSCDTAVFENKGKHRCFLLSCRGSCILSKNENYISSVIDRQMSSTPTPTGKTEETADSDLDLDANISDNNRSNADGTNGNGGVADNSKSLETVSLKGNNTTAAATDTSTAAATGFLPHTEKQGQADLELSTEKPLNTGDDSQEDNQHSSEEHTQPSSNKSHEEENRHDSDEEGKPGSKQETQKEDSVSSEEEAVAATHQPTVNRTVASITTTTAPHNGFVFVERVAEIVEGGDLQVPIIALSVGLVFTLILLLFVACRLCRVRRQLRKSRPLHCNEADYLINGMYL